MWFILRPVAEPADLRHDTPARARDRVVRPLSRAAARPCSRPGCPTPASATLRFSYGTREAWLGGLSEDRQPEAYDLCGAHADRTRPPHGWDLVDERPADAAPERAGGPPADLGGERTVAVLAAALRAVPSEPEPQPQPADGAAAAGEGHAEVAAPSDGVRDHELEDLLEELAAFEAEVAAPASLPTAVRSEAVSQEPHDETLQLAIEAIDELGETGRAERW